MSFQLIHGKKIPVAIEKNKFKYIGNLNLQDQLVH